VKYAWIKRHRAIYPLGLMCALLAVSLSGFRAWLRGGSPDRQRLSDAQVVALIRAIHAEVKCAYGSPRMLDELRARGFAVGKARVERLMREHDIRARHKRRFKATTPTPSTTCRSRPMSWSATSVPRRLIESGVPI
jgi:putative transposase